ncbi:MAG: MBL fold metallo-hydrolase [bacterium]|nr:MBL fold metallo-hydrolase [bacterium]
MKKGFSLFTYIGLFLIAINAAVWYLIIFPRSVSSSELYFLSVGQGDSSLLLLPKKDGKQVKFLIDGGPINGGLNSNLEKILGLDKYIDAVFVTHPELDHFGGLIEVLKTYQVGAVLYNGDERDNDNWAEFNRMISEKKIAKIALAKGDSISYADSMLKVFNSANLLANTNDSGLVMGLETDGFRALFTADVGAVIEKILAQSENIKSDILKVGHHGSKYSSDLSFLEKVEPKISVVEVGKNSYGHPTKEALDRLKEVGSQIFNTYQQGVIKIVKERGELKVFNL